MATRVRSVSSGGDARGLTPQSVADIQRRRLLSAAAIAVCEEGAANVTVTSVVELARVSRRTFYELFDGIGDCLLTVFEDALAQAHGRMAEAWKTESIGWQGRVRDALAALLMLFDSRPELARLLVVEWPTAGADALRRRSEFSAKLARAFDEGRDDAKDAHRGPPALTAEGLVGAVASILRARLLEPEPAGRMIDLLNPLMSMIVLPYRGASAARRELRRPVPAADVPEPATQADDLVERLDIRVTRRTVSVLRAVAAHPGASNRLVAQRAGVTDQGQISKLMRRLERAGLVENRASEGARGAPNAWMLTGKGERVERLMVGSLQAWS